MLNTLVHKYNAYRKERYFKNPLFQTRNTYSIIGWGLHGITNLYPVLKHYNIRIKYICTKNRDWGAEAKQLFPDSIFTNDINTILNDDTVSGVFVSANPDAHFSLLHSLLKANKKIFVEKPPCRTLSELHQLVEIAGTGICKVGLQRRYWPGNKPLLKKISAADTYLYQFYLGAFPHPNVFTELFIHPLDYCQFLFGSFQLLSKTIQKSSVGITLQLHVQHQQGNTGLIELSTQESWTHPVDQLLIHCANEKLTVSYPMLVSGVQKKGRVFNIPAERLLNQPTITREYFSVGNLVLPVQEMNTLVLQGFYKELETFIHLAESGKCSAPKNDLPGLVPLYKVLEELQVLVLPNRSA